MPARRHISPNQLKMFMTPNELRAYGVAGGTDQSPDEDFDELLDRKLDDSYGIGLVDDIKKKGVKTPIQVIHMKNTTDKMIGHGHHRFAIASEFGPDELVPVLHTDAVYKEDPDDSEVDKRASLKKYSTYMEETGRPGKGVTDRFSWIYDY